MFFFPSFLLCDIFRNLLFPSWSWSPFGHLPFTFVFKTFGILTSFILKM
jgi:hypothetical protein